MSKKNLDKSNLPPRLEFMLEDVYNVVKKIYEIGVQDGAEFAAVSLIKHLNEIDNAEEFVALLKQQREKK